MQTSWTCAACGVENTAFRAMCLSCGVVADTRLSAGRTRDYLLNRHPFIATLTGIVSIASGLYIFTRGLLGLIIGVPFCSFGVLALRQARRMTAARAEGRLVTDKRPPILYIRRFLYDGSEENESPEPPLWLVLVLPPVWLAMLLTRRRSYEERLSEVLDRFGPCVTLGRPYEKLPEIGFIRIYATDDKWRETLVSYLNSTQLLIIRASNIVNALLWEIQQTIAQVSPERIIIFLPFGVDPKNTIAAHEYDIFRLSVQGILPTRLPEWQPRALFITFDEHWTPALITARGTVEKTLEQLVSSMPLAPADRYAGFWIRFAAALLDILAISILLVVTIFVLALLSSLVVVAQWLLARANMWFWILPALVFITSWRCFQASIGQLIFGLRVVDIQTAERPAFWQCGMRYFGFILCFITFGVGFVFVAFDRKKQGWHDKLAQTIVVRNGWRNSTN